MARVSPVYEVRQQQEKTGECMERGTSRYPPWTIASSAPETNSEPEHALRNLVAYCYPA